MKQILKRAGRAAFYGLAMVWRLLMFRTTFIAITGSVGKTTGKEALAAILARRCPIIKTELSNNCLPDLARLILRVRPWHRFAVLEVATDGRGWMKHMAWLVRPDIAVILRVAKTHSTNFRTLEATAAEKSMLLTTIRRGGAAVLNGDDPLVSAMAARTPRRVVRFGTSPAFDVWADGIRCSFPEPLEFGVHARGESAQIRVPLVGEHWTVSMLGAITAARLCGVSLAESAEALAALRPVQARMQPITTPSGAVILRDDQSGSAATLEEAFEAFRQARAGRKLVVISDVSDDPSKQRLRAANLGRMVAGLADVGVFVGDRAKHASKGAIAAGMPPDNVHAFLSLPSAAEFLRRELRSGDLVLLKGRLSDHIGRLALAQFGEIGCWVEHCGKLMECDNCEELRPGMEQRPPLQLVSIPAQSAERAAG